ncbi:MAG: META domain-containing protein [Burkholderiales bacterium]
MNLRITRLGVSLSLIMIGLLAACTAVSPAADRPELNGTAWVLATLGQHPVAGNAPTLRFGDGRASGSDGCNRYSAPYSVTGARLEVSPKGISTQMACPPEVAAQASAFMSALTQARAYRVAAGKLELLSADGAVLASFAAQSQSLAGTSWKVTGFNNGRQAVVSVLTGTDLTLAFAGDGKLSGSAGCNRYTAAYTSAGQKLTIGPAAATRRMCAQPEGVMEQEQQFLKALETVATARFEGDRLELRTAEDALAMTLVKVPG